MEGFGLLALAREVRAGRSFKGERVEVCNVMFSGAVELDSGLIPVGQFVNSKARR